MGLTTVAGRRQDRADMLLRDNPMNELLLLQAIAFAAHKHRDQRRKDDKASPYINHPVTVALLLAEVGHITDVSVLAAAILHDTLEDTDTTVDELNRVFSPVVRKLVEEVTDDEGVSKIKRKRLQIEHAKHLSPGAALIKLADKTANVLDVTNAPPADWSRARRREYLDWAAAVVGNCPKVNDALERYFAQVLRIGHEKLRSAA
jgi:(p)ppGpp synthase/HD superfamily hydrolase